MVRSVASVLWPKSTLVGSKSLPHHPVAGGCLGLWGQQGQRDLSLTMTTLLRSAQNPVGPHPWLFKFSREVFPASRIQPARLGWCAESSLPYGDRFSAMVPIDSAEVAREITIRKEPKVCISKPAWRIYAHICICANVWVCVHGERWIEGEWGRGPRGKCRVQCLR